MPSRHISPQSFDDILSELGDDPAIPDPHGIRKSPAPKDGFSSKPKQVKNDFLDNLHFQVKGGNLGLYFLIIVIAIALAVMIFFVLDSFKTNSQLVLERTQSQITELKKELTQYRDDAENIEDELYGAIDELEVSVHSKMILSPQTKLSNTPKADPHESELRRWRYLGTAQVGETQQAFFQSSKARLTLQLGSQALGDWQLSGIQKDRVTLVNPKGKSLTLRTTKAE